MAAPTISSSVFFAEAFRRFKSHGFRCCRLRHENLHNFEKNLDQNGLLRKKLEHFEIGQPKILRSKNFEKLENFHFQTFSNDNFDENFRDFSISKFLVGRFQNALTFFIINRFGRDFFQSCVDFHGGGDRRCLRAS